MIKGICSNVLEIVEPTGEGYQLILRLDLAKIPQGKGLVILHMTLLKSSECNKENIYEQIHILITTTS